MKPRLRFAAAACVAAGLAAAAPHQLRGAELPRMTRLADGVFAYEHLDPTKRGVTVNNLVVVADDGVLVADGQGTVANTRELVAAIAAITAAPIRYVVVGSIHGDHRGGDAGFPASATFVKEKTDLVLDGREVRVLMLGRAHTGTDLEVWLPREQIIYMSEVFSNRVFPSMANGYPTEWVAALQSAEALDARIYMPAHAAADAPAEWTKENVGRYRSAIERVIAEGRRLHDAKVAVEDAPAGADWGAFTSWVRRPENSAGALKRVYMEIDRVF
jgi:glyoxylase-like metal-dependent hydrolase (beta-lactamase superfamily II)